MNSNVHESSRAKLIFPGGNGRKRKVMKRSIPERILLMSLVMIGMILVLGNIFVIFQFDDSSTLLSRDADFLAKSIGSKESSPERQRGNRDIIDEELLRVLRRVGIHNASQLTEEERLRLPSWSEVVEKFGNDGPKIIGLETCATYRSNVELKKRRIGVAGPFNSGTHFLFEILRKNCKTWKERRGRKQDEVLYQVPWGKHQSANFRLIHNTRISNSIHSDEKNPLTGKLDHPSLPKHLMDENLSVLPIVVVRDPYTWWQSMCRSRYSAHWYHVVPDHCPNFVPNHVEKDWFDKSKKEVRRHYHGDPWKVDNVLEKANFTLDKQVVPLWVRYHSENRHHASLAHMWTDWYNDYFVGSFPRLLVRLEDLVFQPHETLRLIYDCANDPQTKNVKDFGTQKELQTDEDARIAFQYVGDEHLELVLESAIGGSGQGVDNIHGSNRTGLIDAMAKHGGPFSNAQRMKGMTSSDLDFAASVLAESETWKQLGYQLPRRAQEQN